MGQKRKTKTKTPRSKTFTGCWSCRRRKRKCDERRPNCLRCEERGHACEGYGAKLHWLPPSCDYQTSSVKETAGDRVTWQRREIISTPPLEILSSEDLDRILADIDASTSTTQLELFGVITGIIDALDVEQSPTLVERIATGDHWPSPLADELSENETNAEQDCFHQDDCPTDNRADLARGDAVGPARSDDLPSIEAAIATPCSTPDRYILHSRNHALCQESRYLLEHYIYKVVSVFTVVNSPKSPWKMFHIPTVLRTIGELEVSGSTSFVRVTLLYAILSVSAFHKANDCTDHSSKATWTLIATERRYKAIQYLNRAMNAALIMRQPVKYKEMLAAVLTMITIDVVSGDTETCILHLDGCEDFIQYVGRTKSKYSHKAKVLHRHYLYLRTIHDSARLREVCKRTRAEECALDETCPTTNTSGTSSPSFVNIPYRARGDLSWLDVSESSDNDMTACEFVYGVPLSLLRLIRRATAIIQSEIGTRRSAQGCGLRSSAYDEVEASILHWPMDAELARKAHLFNGLHAELIRHQTIAYHQALLIYFAQHYRTLPHQYLRPSVEAVLESLEYIEELKHKAEVCGGPGFWPAFIAASEAFDEDLQTRFRAWFDKVEMYCLSSIRPARDLIYELWSLPRKPVMAGTSRWRMLAESKQISLMLS